LSFNVAVTVPINLAFVASDTRSVRDGGQRDDYRKIAATPSGWLVGGGLTAVTDHLAPAVAGCATLADVHATVLGESARFQGFARAAGLTHRDPRQALLYFAEPGDLAALFWRTGELERRGHTIACQLPFGVELPEFPHLFSAYQDALFPFSVERLIEATGRLFAQVSDRSGGRVGPVFEMGFIVRGETVEHWHLPPGPSAAPEPGRLRRVAPAEVRFGWIAS
jgi:hypothetical protein